MSDDVKRESECEVVPQTRRGCDAVERGRDREVVGRIGGRDSEVAG